MSGSDAALNSLTVSNGITGSLQGTASFATTALSASFASTASFLNNTTNAFIQNGNSFGATATLGTNDNQPLALETNGSTRLFVSSSGNVGIGTLTPQRLFDVFTTTNTSGIIASFGATLSNNNFSGIGFGYVEQGNTSYRKSSLVFERTETHGGGSNASGKIHFLLNNNGGSSATAITDAVVTIDSVGGTVGSSRMGIGTRFPTASLHISGTVATDNLMRVQSVTGAEYFFISSSGSLGIGTITPNAKLDVNGNTIITGSLQISASIFQYSNNASITTASIGNIASFPTSSYQAGFFDYVASSGTNARAGTIFTVWNGTSIEFSETATNDIGLTNNLILSASLSSGNILLQGRSLSGSWSVKTLTRMI